MEFSSSVVLLAGSQTITGDKTFNGIQTFENLEAEQVSGSFSGSFEGEGSNLTGVSASYILFSDIANKPSLISESAQIDVVNTTNWDQVVNISQSQTITGVKTFSGDNIFEGLQTFDSIDVSGTASFSVIQSITGSAKIIGDAFITLNNNLPTERYAGIIVQDSGSGSPLTTASFQFDGQTNDWFYEYSDDGGATTDHGVVIFGPAYNTKGSPTYLTLNTIPKGTGEHHLVDSSIVDSGSEVYINNSLRVESGITGSISGSLVGDLIGTASFADTSISSSFADISTSSSFANTSVSSSLAENSTSSSYAITASFALNAGGGSGAGFPFEGKAEISGSLEVSGSVIIDGSLTELSSLRYKSNVNTLKNALDNVSNLRGVTFEKNSKTEIGLIAEEVVKYYPEIVTLDQAGQPDGVEYSRVGSILIEAIKELNNRVKELEEKVKSLS